MEISNTAFNFQKGSVVYFLSDYTLMYGIIESIGKKNIKINYQFFGDKTTCVSFDKVADPNESIAIIWEMWKGKNGRGGYRLEKELYPSKRKIAKEWPYQALIWEDAYGKESNFNDPKLC